MTREVSDVPLSYQHYLSAQEHSPPLMNEKEYVEAMSLARQSQYPVINVFHLPSVAMLSLPHAIIPS